VEKVGLAAKQKWVSIWAVQSWVSRVATLFAYPYAQIAHVGSTANGNIFIKPWST